MSSLYKQYKTDTAKEESGVWFDVGMTNDDKTVPGFLVCRMGKTNKRYSKALEAATRPYRRLIQTGNLPDDVAEKTMREVFCRTIVIDCRNVFDADGKSVTYSVPAMGKLFSELPELYDEVQNFANQVSNFRAEALEAEAKN